MKAQFVITDIEWLFKQHDEENKISEIMTKNNWNFEYHEATKDIELDFPITIDQDIWVDGFEDIFKIEEICFMVDENKTKYFLLYNQ
jgi:hypothetical protein